MRTDIKRGSVYCIDIPHAIGSEMMKNRPGVIVSCDAINLTSGVVSVVYLTGSKVDETPLNVKITSAENSRHGFSVALCDHIYSVDKSRVHKRICAVSDEEMAKIEKGLLKSLALGDGKLLRMDDAAALQQSDADDECTSDHDTPLIRVVVEVTGYE